MNSKKIISLLTTAFSDFNKNKIRSILTALGIMIGVLSVVLLIALGLGLKNYLSEQFESLGANLVIVFPGNVFNNEAGAGGNFGRGFAGGVNFDEKDYLNLKKIPEADFVVPAFTKSLSIQYQDKSRLGTLYGTTVSAFELLNINLETGKEFTEADVDRRSRKVVLGFEIAKSLFDKPELALNKTVILGNERLKVIGVAAKKGDQDVDNAAMVPYTTTFGSLNPNKTFFNISLGTKREENVTALKDATETILSRRYDEEDFTVTEQTEILSTVNQVFAMVNAILLAIGSISLIVGGIGIMNIMYASVTERTKEVGIRRAIGATKADILGQFLAEAVVLSVLGGLVGLFLASIIVLIVRNFFPAEINAVAVAVAFFVSAGIGIFFGVFPANKAAELPPIEAIRYE
jgi:putative ABC transport system permease protein